MPSPEYEDLPFWERPDLTPYLVHLTRSTKAANKRDAFDNLVNILRTGTIWGSTSAGFVGGPNTAACLMDVPFASLKYVFGTKNMGKNGPRYEPYGIFISKKLAYKKGCRPVLYLSKDEQKNRLRVPDKELWRVVRLQVDSDERWTSWLHEREWRCKGDLKLPSNPYGVLVRKASEATRLQECINQSPKTFKVKPQSIIPIEVICQGLFKA